MKRDEYWKNFKLGKELDIAGRFIYNGLYTFHEMEHFVFEEEIFEFLYNISVGIERLLKIAVVLTEHNSETKQIEFEKSLITHNHDVLLQRLKRERKINFSSSHNKFLMLLSKFYKTYRYHRYSLISMSIEDWEQIELIDFLNENLKISIDIKTFFGVTPNDSRIKRFIGKIVGKISEALYDIISNEARRLNIYTDEIRYPSKAFKIFTMKEYTFEKEELLRKELLVYFINNKHKGELSKFIRSIEPLDFDPGLESDYMNCFNSNIKLFSVMDELDTCYEEEVRNKKDRIELMELLGNKGVCYEEDDDSESGI